MNTTSSTIKSMALQSNYLSSMCNNETEQLSKFLHCSMCDQLGCEHSKNILCPTPESRLHNDVGGMAASLLQREPFRQISQQEVDRDFFSNLGGRETLSAENLLKCEYPLEVYSKTLNRSSEDLNQNFSTECGNQETFQTSLPGWGLQEFSSKTPLEFSVPLTKSLDDFKYASYPTNVSLYVLDHLCDMKMDNTAFSRWKSDSDSLNSNLLFQEFNTLSSRLSPSASHFSTLCLESLTLHDKEFQKRILSRQVVSHNTNQTPNRESLDNSETTSEAIYENRSTLGLTRGMLETGEERLETNLKNSNKFNEKKLTGNHWVALPESLEYPEHLQNARVIFHVTELRRGNSASDSFFHQNKTRSVPSTTKEGIASITANYAKMNSNNSTRNCENHPNNCKPCAFFWTKGCVNGDSCSFCHEQHIPKKKKSIEDQKNLLIIARPDGRIEYLRCNVKEALLRC